MASWCKDELVCESSVTSVGISEGTMSTMDCSEPDEVCMRGPDITPYEFAELVELQVENLKLKSTFDKLNRTVNEQREKLIRLADENRRFRKTIRDLQRRYEALIWKHARPTNRLIVRTRVESNARGRVKALKRIIQAERENYRDFLSHVFQGILHVLGLNRIRNQSIDQFSGFESESDCESDHIDDFSGKCDLTPDGLQILPVISANGTPSTYSFLTILSNEDSPTMFCSPAEDLYFKSLCLFEVRNNAASSPTCWLQSLRRSNEYCAPLALKDCPSVVKDDPCKKKEPPPKKMSMAFGGGGGGGGGGDSKKKEAKKSEKKSPKAKKEDAGEGKPEKDVRKRGSTRSGVESDVTGDGDEKKPEERKISDAKNGVIKTDEKEPDVEKIKDVRGTNVSEKVAKESSQISRTDKSQQTEILMINTVPCCSRNGHHSKALLCFEGPKILIAQKSKHRLPSENLVCRIEHLGGLQNSCSDAPLNVYNTWFSKARNENICSSSSNLSQDKFGIRFSQEYNFGSMPKERDVEHIKDIITNHVMSKYCSKQSSRSPSFSTI